MATVEERYAAATAYVRRAIDVVEGRGISYLIDPVTGIVEWYAGKTKTQQPRNELARIEARWLRATSDADRGVVARDAELLADRVEESLPGAPQDRARTNLYAGETPRGTPATTYGQELAMQASESWDWLSDAARGAADTAGSIGKWLVLGGGIALGWKALSFLRERSRLAALEATTERSLNASLEHEASR